MTEKPIENHAPSARPADTQGAGPADGPADGPAEAGSASEAQQPVEFEVRVAPKPGAFMLTGGVLGVILALISAWLRGGTEDHSMGAVFGFLAVLFAIIGVGVGAIVFLIFDRVGRKRTQHIYAVKETDQETGSGVTK